MERNDVKWIMRHMLAAALSGDEDANGKVRNEILHCAFIVRDRVFPPMAFGKGARRSAAAWTAMRDMVLTESIVMMATFDGRTFAYRPSVDRVLTMLAQYESHPNGKAWWLDMKVNDTVFIPGH